jgi:histidinol-phosphatase (PHP family)
MRATFHNHSTWSDGQEPPASVYAHADAIGVDLLGISDHFCIMPDGTIPVWSLTPDKVAFYLDELRSLRGKGRVEIVAGLEFDWFEQSHAVLAPHTENLPLDYRIGSVHFVGGKAFDIDASFWASKTEEEIDAVYAAYWRLVRGMAESRLFDIAGHLDLPKKFGFHPKADLRGLEDEALDAIKASGMTVELNTAGFGKPCAEGYPSLGILKRCRDREIPVTLSADAHRPDRLLFEFERGFATLRAAGYSAVARFRRRERWLEPLASSP